MDTYDRGGSVQVLETDRLVLRRLSEEDAGFMRSLLNDHARSRLGLARIVALVNRENTASIRVLERLGLRYEKTIRLPGDATDRELFAADG